MIWQQISHCTAAATTPPIRGGNDELEPNSTDFRGDHQLWVDWAFMRTFQAVSDTNLTRAPQNKFFIFHLILDKLLPVNPRALMDLSKTSLLRKAEADLDHQTKAYPSCSHGWHWSVDIFFKNTSWRFGHHLHGSLCAFTERIACILCMHLGACRFFMHPAA